MESWMVFFLSSSIMLTGAAAGASNGATLVLLLSGLIQLAVAIGLKLLS